MKMHQKLGETSGKHEVNPLNILSFAAQYLQNYGLRFLKTLQGKQFL